ncbi:potassium channel family protein [Aquimarina sp. 2201CG5-10]|uniref:potassium channel family protein n=1 Tax=Aquimarina callyspongiae TaxID=3098150 RepID=UPI002AB52A5A|nr:potassium channel family protein [Aquimarina sp. 2201CG5-10]MDY8137960.1 potassium channel family protein [Aquimarina sp. 2201CG5-10]
MIDRLYNHRFEIFLGTQIAILFGSLFFPLDFYEYVLLPSLYLISNAAGILMISKRKKLTWFFIGLFVITAFMFGSSMISRSQNLDNILIRLSIYFIFHIVVTWNIIHQVWNAQFVNKNVIMGLMSGYISLGFLAFFLFMSIELVNPGSFTGVLLETSNAQEQFDSILYYAYITLLTIGYGEIVPVSPVAQKAAILVGLIGQFYMVIITAVIVEKYIIHSRKT